MGTIIERIELAEGGWRNRHSALRLAVRAAQDCLHNAGRNPHDIDLLINAGVYRDRNLGEPALAAMIQQDIGANPEEPHGDSHGTFSFDVVNGSCGMLTALQIVDGFLRSKAIDCALIVASDADPGHGMSERFPFSPSGAAALCTWTDEDRGLGHLNWTNHPGASESFSASIGLLDHRNVLRFKVSASADESYADASAEAVDDCLTASSTDIESVAAIVAAPSGRRYRDALAARLGIPSELITVADDARMHTASLASAFKTAVANLDTGAHILLVAAGAGVTAGAAMYRL
ncbi:3-oxoacyl-[acyl-carrier-protein] synthase III C-terminal domain-containing protein [Mycolicibacterium stellerae]|uniref:3-oxoacyl-[acyl-carrier-protein] synthase III C-terminal domain-containing protein n=1 Tax=Mycolicibacterium stellerae TaxID=2358193 RepID=UPI000F0BD346|nr:3-oxoacyl-[acyl-carrier-protein] synthase III C-terminal domain-containing protein [Mycolicibacterium stellerae]